jgi:hypothetical protein
MSTGGLKYVRVEGRMARELAMRVKAAAIEPITSAASADRTNACFSDFMKQIFRCSMY